MIENSDKKLNLRLATFAGGCFWCMIPPFQKLDGIYEVIAGYIGGHAKNPTYDQVCSANTGHYEAVQLKFDPEKISYDKLLETFWRQIDPTDLGGQFYDRGQQYNTAIFYHDEEQKRLSEASKAKMESEGRFNKAIATKILKASEFYPAEEYHQNYHLKNSEHYKRYRIGSGRDSYIEKTWGMNKSGV